jgi:hypothetical protein
VYSVCCANICLEDASKGNNVHDVNLIYAVLVCISSILRVCALFVRKVLLLLPLAALSCTNVYTEEK